VWIFAAVLQDDVFLELKFSAEFLVALSARMRMAVDMMTLVMANHVISVGEYLVAVAVLAGDR
jgi:hypothetical protein